MRRILITGAPCTGKSTLAASLGLPHYCTDPSRMTAMGIGTPDHLDWSEASEYVAREWLTMPGPWVIEGVAVPRALRKWGSDTLPADKLVVLTVPHVELTSGQRMMGSALHCVLDELADWLAPILEYR